MLDRRSHIMDRILSRTKRDGDCLIWTGPTSGTGRGGGYGRMCLSGQTVAVHRVVYTHYFGYVPGKNKSIISAAIAFALTRHTLKWSLTKKTKSDARRRHHE